MNTRLAIVISLLFLTGCSFHLGGPTTTVRKFLDEANKGDVDAMSKLFSSKAIQNIGAETIRSNNQQFSEMTRGANVGKYRMDQLQERRNGDTARVSFFYKKQDQSDSLRMIFDLSKEDGVWKIDDIGGAEKEKTTGAESGTTPSPSINETPVVTERSSRAPISAGVLNGKATYLPKPSYPPIAKTAKASGAVNVQVTVDEEGKVISASAVSGHPLLRAVSEAAGRQARFSPTLLSGKPVKVTGILVFYFVAE